MNIRLQISALSWICLATGLLGCSPSQTPLPTSGTARNSDSHPQAAGCDPRMPSIQQMMGVLTAPLIDRKPVAGDGQTCEFLTAGFSAITVSVRPDVGRVTLDAWTAGKMPFTATQLAGVGEQAVWQDTLREVIAQKNNLLCDIEIRGGESDIAATIDLLPGVLGALCNTVFAAFG